MYEKKENLLDCVRDNQCLVNILYIFLGIVF